MAGLVTPVLCELDSLRPMASRDAWSAHGTQGTGECDSLSQSSEDGLGGLGPCGLGPVGRAACGLGPVAWLGPLASRSKGHMVYMHIVYMRHIVCMRSKGHAGQ